MMGSFRFDPPYRKSERSFGVDDEEGDVAVAGAGSCQVWRSSVTSSRGGDGGVGGGRGHWVCGEREMRREPQMNADGRGCWGMVWILRQVGGRGTRCGYRDCRRF